MKRTWSEETEIRSRASQRSDCQLRYRGCKCQILLDPSGLTLAVLARATTAVVDAGLTFLRFGGETVDVVSNVPDLVDVVLTATPDLWLSL